ncbi:MAG: hypothetical protein IPF93_08305 [Saprospiraceae bacterium]|nr:hypothetical protein [Saprospiraceae bacterium]
MKKIYHHFLILIMVIALRPDHAFSNTPPIRKADVIVYGGTSAAIIAAVQVKAWVIQL